MPTLAFTADSRQTEAGRLYNRSEEDETRIPLQKAIDDADYEHGHRVHELDFLTAFRSPRLRQPPKRLDKRVPQDGIGARLGHPRPSLRCPGQPRAAGAPPRPPNPQDQLTSTADGSGSSQIFKLRNLLESSLWLNCFPHTLGTFDGTNTGRRR